MISPTRALIVSLIAAVLMASPLVAEVGGAPPSVTNAESTVGTTPIGSPGNCHNWPPPPTFSCGNGCPEQPLGSVDCPPGQVSTGNSVINNSTLDYAHEAIDFMASPTTASGCSSCGSAQPGWSGIEARAALPCLTIRRLLRPNLLGTHSSFGPGCFWEHDSTVQFRQSGGVWSGTVFMPRNHLGLSFQQAGDRFTDGAFNAFRDIRLYRDLAQSSPTAEPTQAAYAVLTAWEGWQETFELVGALGAGDVPSAGTTETATR
jgi:hypothetical protein